MPFVTVKRPFAARRRLLRKRGLSDLAPCSPIFAPLSPHTGGERLPPAIFFIARKRPRANLHEALIWFLGAGSGKAENARLNSLSAFYYAFISRLIRHDNYIFQIFFFHKSPYSLMLL